MLVQIRSFLTGPPAYRPAPTWRAWLAALLTLSIVAIAQLLAGAIFPVLTGIDVTSLPGLRPGHGTTPGLAPQTAAALLMLLLLSQGLTIALTLAVALHGGVRDVLKLVRPDGGWSRITLSLLAFVPVIAVFNMVAYLIAPDRMAEDFRFFRHIAGAASFGTTLLAIGPGAALSEELLFRGFLLTALSATWLGFWPSAVAASLAWTLLHWGYSSVGLAEVFLIGLYFSWLLWRTNSLWPAIVCHATYNSCLLVLLRLLPA